MLCTAISDTYRTDERAEVDDALAMILGPGQPNWTTTGVYAYWDFESRELLCVGLANDLSGRSAQHNRIAGTPAENGHYAESVRDCCGFATSGTGACICRRDVSAAPT